MNAPKMIAKLCKVIKFDKISQKMTEKMVHIYLKQNLFFFVFYDMFKPHRLKT